MFRRTVYTYSIFMILIFITILGTCSATLGNQTYIEAVSKQSTYKLTISHPRKTIYDRNLVPLTNIKKKYISAVVPSVESIGKIQGVTDIAKHSEVQAALANGKPFLIEVESPINSDEISTFTVPERYDVNQPAANLIGYTDNSIKGISGIERSYNDELMDTGTISVTFTVDALGQAIKGAVIETENNYSEKDSGIALTIDRSIQSIVETGCTDIEKGAAVVLECGTGNILALASFPTFNPHALEEALCDPNEPFINRALCAYAPGSIFKLVVAAAALEHGADYRAVYTCSGTTEVDGLEFSCFDQIPHGEVNMHTALRQSCNGYFIHLVEQIGAENVLSLAEICDFGKEYEIARELVTAVGTLPSNSEIENLRASANFSFGQGSLSITPLHAAAFINTIASDGVYYMPNVFLGYINEDKSVTGSVEAKERRVMEKTTATRLRAYMESTAQFGTARGGCPKNCIAGIKTGTAQTWIYDEQGQEIQNFWYAGYICDSNEIPKFTILIMEESSSASHVPHAFKKIAESLADFT